MLKIFKIEQKVTELCSENFGGFLCSPFIIKIQAIFQSFEIEKSLKIWKPLFAIELWPANEWLEYLRNKAKSSPTELG